MQIIPTRHGPVGYWPPTSETDAPLVLVVRGFMDVHGLRDVEIAGVDVGVVCLPGHMTPSFPAYSVEAFAEAFDDLIAARHPERRIVVLGVSLGAAVAVSMRAPQIKAMVLVEPFLRSAHLWPLVAFVRHMVIGKHEDMTRFCAEVFGYHADRVEPRAYPVRTRVPLYVVAGDEPLDPPRSVQGLPSLCDDVDRQWLTGKGARFYQARGGHNVPANDRPAMMQALAAAVKSVR